VTEQEMLEKLLSQESHLVNLANNQEAMKRIQEKQADALEMVAKDVSQVGIVLERMSNLDANFRESFNRVHKRIDEVEADYKEDTKKAFNRDNMYFSVGMAAMTFLFGYLYLDVRNVAQSIKDHDVSDAIVTSEIYDEMNKLKLVYNKDKATYELRIKALEKDCEELLRHD
jgi:hypothetical protein